MENKFNTDEQLRNAFRDFEVTPDSRSFDAILEKMNREKKRRAFIIFFWTGLLALSGITVLLMFHVYGGTTTSGIPAPRTYAGSSTQHQASTAHTSVTNAYLQTTQTSQASTDNASNPETKSPEVKPGTISPSNYPDVISATAVSSSKDDPRQDLLKQAGKPDTLSGLTDSENKDKNASATVPVKEVRSMHAITSIISSDEEAITGSMPAIAATDLMYMTPLTILPRVDPGEPDLITSLKEVSYPALFVSREKKNTVSFYLGAQASPGLNTFAFSKNPNRNPAYNTSGTNFPDVYLKAKKDQSHLSIGFPFGLKAGIQINNKYEVFAGFGIQTFTETEKLYTYPTPTVQPNPTSNNLATQSYAASTSYRFRYLYYSLEANRLFSGTRVIGFKLGLGLCGNQLINSSYVVASPIGFNKAVQSRENVSPWLLITKVKAGVIFNTNRRFQLHISPGFFYSATSVFKRDHVIRQKPFGADIECLLLFRLFKI